MSTVAHLVLPIYCAMWAGWLVSGFSTIFSKRERDGSTHSVDRVCRHPVSGVRGISQVIGLVDFHNAKCSMQAASPSFSVSSNDAWSTNEKILDGQQENSGSFRGILFSPLSSPQTISILLVSSWQLESQKIISSYFLCWFSSIHQWLQIPE